MNTFVVSSPLTSEELGARLSTLARGWRESAQPAVVRALPAQLLKVQLQQHRFHMYVTGLQPRRLLTFRGRVTAVCAGQFYDTASGCRIEAQFTPSRTDWVAPFVGLALWVRTWTAAAFAAIVALAFALEFVVHWAAAAEQCAALRAVLIDVAAASSSPTPSPLLSPAP